MKTLHATELTLSDEADIFDHSIYPGDGWFFVSKVNANHLIYIDKNANQSSSLFFYGNMKMEDEINSPSLSPLPESQAAPQQGGGVSEATLLKTIAILSGKDVAQVTF